MLPRLFRNQFEHFHTTVAVAPLVIVPAYNFHESIAEHQREFAVKNARVRITDDVLRNERLLAVFDYALVAFIRSSFLECSIDCIDGRIFFENGGVTRYSSPLRL